MICARPLVLLGSLCLALGCAGVKSVATAPGNGGSGASTGAGGIGNSGAGGTVPTIMACNGPCTDFPTTPIVDGSANMGSAQGIFGATGNSSGGPCIFEPQNGTLFPNNWLRPRFSWMAPAGQNLFELRLHAENQANDLVVYTTNTSWTMNNNDMSNPPASQKAMWTALVAHTPGMAITVTVRGAPSNGGAPSAGTPTTFTVAPVGAKGKLVYWSPSGLTNGGITVAGKTTLSGFSVGDDTVTEVLVPTDVTGWQTLDQGFNRRPVSCIGCHTSTPDGNYIAFNDFYPWGGVLASGQPGTLHGTPLPSPPLGAGGFNAFIQPWLGITTFSANHWADGDHMVVAPLGTSGNDADQQPGLAWIDLESTTASPQGQNPAPILKGTAWNWIVPPASGQYAAAPSWSHKAGHDFVVYTATSNVLSGRIGTGTAHLYQVPYSKTAAQTPTPIPGDGSAAGFAQYYGALSSEDDFIVYDQIPANTASITHTAPNSTCSAPPCTWSGMYMQPAAELFVIPTAGGTATKLAANDPPQCAGQKPSGMINNTWAKWSPDVSTDGDGNTYYWLIFSSWRQGLTDPTTGSPIAQLFATAIVKPEVGPIMTYPAIYLWNQPANISNFTPAWDNFKIPIIIDMP